MLNMLNFGAKIKSIMVFLKKAIFEFQKPSPIVGHVTILKGVLSFEVSHLHGDEKLPRTPPHFDLLIELGHAGITNIK